MIQGKYLRPLAVVKHDQLPHFLQQQLGDLYMICACNVIKHCINTISERQCWLTTSQKKNLHVISERVYIPCITTGCFLISAENFFFKNKNRLRKWSFNGEKKRRKVKKKYINNFLREWKLGAGHGKIRYHHYPLPCSAPILPTSHSLGKLERGGSNVERKEDSKMAGEPCRATQLQQLDRRAGNERSHVKLSQVWDLLALQASFLSHMSYWVININHLWSRLFFVLTGNS